MKRLGKMRVEEWAIGKLRPYKKNPRKNDKAVDAVAESIRRFGFRQPIVVDGKGVIVCGHTRHAAALKLGMTKVPVHVATDLSFAAARAYRLADNKTAELAEWDQELLTAEIAECQGLELMGFAESELRVPSEVAVPQSYGIVVECTNEKDQRALFEDLRAAGRQCRVITL